MNAPDKCPKCGAKQWNDSVDLRTYMCGSQVKNGEMARETDACSLTRRAYLSEMREKLYKDKLNEAMAHITSERERAEKWKAVGQAFLELRARHQFATSQGDYKATEIASAIAALMKQEQ